MPIDEGEVNQQLDRYGGSVRRSEYHCPRAVPPVNGIGAHIGVCRECGAARIPQETSRGVVYWECVNKNCVSRLAVATAEPREGTDILGSLF